MTDKPQSIGQMLGELYTPAEAEIWLTTPQQIFSGMSPVQLIANGQDYVVELALRQILDGVYT